jgi:hypothetical protein
MNFKNKYISSQYIYSDWIFLWFLVYFSPINQNKTFSETFFNPLVSLYIALSMNVFVFIRLLMKMVAPNILVKYGLMMVFEKIIPISLLHRETKSLHIQNNILFTGGLFIIYLGYLHFSNTTFYEVYNSIFYSITKDDNNTPFFALFHTLFGL